MHSEKYKRGDSKRVMNEAYRITDSKSEFYDKRLSNQNIQLWGIEKAQQRLQANMQTAKIRNKETVITANFIITKPKELRPKDEKAFWDEVINYHIDKLGKENLIYAVIHRDELNDHMHICFTPIKEGKFQCKNIINQEFLKSYHRDLQERLDQKFDYHITIERSEEEKEANPHLSMKEFKANKKKEREEVKERIRL